jgi:hypothetical protein
MNRFYAMSQVAKSQLTCNLSNNTTHRPSQFMVEGESNKYGYRISHVTEDLCGFTLVEHVLRLSDVKAIIKSINTTGHFNMPQTLRCL